MINIIKNICKHFFEKKIIFFCNIFEILLSS